MGDRRPIAGSIQLMFTHLAGCFGCLATQPLKKCWENTLDSVKVFQRILNLLNLSLI
jgi:hypothetical protein